MLEVKNLTKTYKPKKGVPVKAIDDISLKFPERGMVFLLGKSGSGKSTLLNLLGGLDKYDDGEITIKGVSSKKFRQQHFDSYRNAYVGFIFQEYNILEEFTVGANIALAIELQGNKATDEQINEILEEVDLSGYGNRKPNELSGGQKQRVAIARALVKNPEIIMADEPTGALDSNTGRQVLETLKKLSENKLVIVVSHDREFAENYADRIIELADGKVISDVELDYSAKEENAESIKFYGNTVEISGGYHLTESDREAINKYIDELENNSLNLSITPKKATFKKFAPTHNSKIKVLNASGFKLIKSKLPLKNAFKIGASGLKHKKIRLAVTIILSCISFGLFGLSDTFGAYNHIKTCTNSIIDTGIDYASVAKSKKMGGEGIDSYWRDYGYKLSKEEISEISRVTGVEMSGVYSNDNFSFDFTNSINPEIKLTETDYYLYGTGFNGFAEINENTLSDFGYYLLAGNIPDGSKNELAISEYIFETFKKAQYTDVTIASQSEKISYTAINNYSDILGKKIFIADKEFVITAVIDTNFDLSRYLDLIEKKEGQSKTDSLVDYVLYSEFIYATNYNLSGAAMVGKGYVENLINSQPRNYNINEGYMYLYNSKVSLDPWYIGRISDVANENTVWLNGAKTTLAENEVIISSSLIEGQENAEMTAEEATEYYKEFFKSGETFNFNYQLFSDNEFIERDDFKVVGVIPINDKNAYLQGTVIMSDAWFNKFVDNNGKGIYNYAVGPMPKSEDSVKRLVSYCYSEEENIRFPIQNAVTYELDSVNEALGIFSEIFLYIGIGFALFAALMLANFIGTSISYKKQDIGILRAIGSRSNDVFRIFFAESFVIALINFVLSVIGVGAVTAFINYKLRESLGILITVLDFGVRQITLLAAVSLLVAFVASFFPVKKIASKRPIDAIRNK